MAAGSEGVLEVAGTGRNRLGGVKETGGGDNDKIGDGFGGGVGRVIDGDFRGEEESQGASELIGAEGIWAEDRLVINLDRRRAGNMAGRDKVVAKT